MSGPERVVLAWSMTAEREGWQDLFDFGHEGQAWRRFVQETT